MSQPVHKKSAEEQMLDSYERVARERLQSRISGAKRSLSLYVREHPVKTVAATGAGAALVTLCARSPIKVGKLVKPLRFAVTTLLAGTLRAVAPTPTED